MSWRNLLGADFVRFDDTAQRLHRKRLAYLRAQFASHIVAGSYVGQPGTAAYEALKVADEILVQTGLMAPGACEECGEPLELCLCGGSQ